MDINFISACRRWHIWQGTAHILVSDEACKGLTYHKTTDDVANFLWLSGYRDVARAFNKHIKEPT